MPELRTPEDVRQEIFKNVVEGRRGPEAQYEAELKAEHADDEYEAAVDQAYLAAEGTVDERKATARLSARTQKDTAIIARAELNRVRAKIRQLDNSTVAWQATLKSIQAEGA
jgi:hypothetical protein